MAKPARQVLQFKITLLEIEPLIWRRIQVPRRYSFWDLHVAIQDAMGWEDYHLHEFIVTDPESGAELSIGIPVDEVDPGHTQAGWEYAITDFFTQSGDTALYHYDFGDDWRHSVLLEGLLLAEKGKRYPVCLDGARHCPLEDCGGVWGYMNFLAAIRDPTHEAHDSMLEWIGGAFDPEAFEATRVRFDNPKKRRQLLS